MKGISFSVVKTVASIKYQRSMPSNHKMSRWLCGSADITGLAIITRSVHLMADLGLSEIGGVTLLY